MKNICSNNICTGCGACAESCPTKCIEINFDRLGFLFPVINNKVCINCGKCKKVCPAINNIKTNTSYLAYRAHNLNDIILKKSTSGGMFYALSKHVIEKKGYIFGVEFNKTFTSVQHNYTTNFDGLEKFYGSKYIQSETKNSYRKVRELLANDEWILFTGTPCQIAGLNNFLENINTEKLITCDFICHGVASTKVFNMHMKDKIQEFNSKIKSVKFRSKKNGYKNACLEFEFENGESDVEPSYNNYFGYGFANNIINRKSCNTCKYAKITRTSDFTIADYIGKDATPFEQKSGVSILLINTLKAEKIFDDVKSTLEYSKKTLDEIIKLAPHLTVSSSEHYERDMFFKYLNHWDYSKLSNKFLLPKKFIRRNIIMRVLIKIKRKLILLMPPY